MKRTMFTKVSAIGVLTLLFSGISQAFIPPIPATDGSRQIIANQIAEQTNTLETKENTIISSIGSGLSTKIDRINNNMKIPVTASGTISSAGSYILSNNITGPITITSSDVSFDLNEFKITGSLTINGAVSNVDIYNGAIETSSGSCIDMIGTMSVIVFDDLYIKQTDSGAAAIEIPSAGSDVLITGCWIVGSTNNNAFFDHYGVWCQNVSGDITIERCIIYNFYYGIVQSGDGLLVRNCQIMKCGDSTNGAGIYFDSNFTSCHRNIVRNNILRENGIGIRFSGSDFEDNFFFQNVVTGSTNSVGAIYSTLGTIWTTGGNQIFGAYAYQNNGPNYDPAPSLTDTVVSATTGFYVNLDLV